MNAREAVCRTLDALAEAGIAHMVTGGLVANAHGIARSTKDADIVIQVHGETFNAFVRSLPSELELDAQLSFETITGSRRHIIQVRDTPFQIELFFLGDDAHHQERFKRRLQKFLPDIEREAWMASAEDMIIQKLRWNRDKDREDAKNIMGVQGSKLDWSYIERWCDAHDTRARLEEIRRAIPPEV